MKRILFASAAALGLALTAPANAISSFNGTIATIDSTDPFSWGVDLVATVNSGGGTPTNVTAHADFTFTGFSGGSYNFTYDIENTSTESPSNLSRLGAVGFDVTPVPNSATDSDTSDPFSVSFQGNGQFNGLGPVTLCLYAGQNCNGGANDGLLPGASATGGFSLNYTGTAPTAIDLTNFLGRWQATQVGSTSGGPCTSGDCGGGGGGPGVPETATWMMLIIGFGTMGRAIRTRKGSARAAVA